MAHETEARIDRVLKEISEISELIDKASNENQDPQGTTGIKSPLENKTKSQNLDDQEESPKVRDQLDYQEHIQSQSEARRLRFSTPFPTYRPKARSTPYHASDSQKVSVLEDEIHTDKVEVSPKGILNRQPKRLHTQNPISQSTLSRESTTPSDIGGSSSGLGLGLTMPYIHDTYHPNSIPYSDDSEDTEVPDLVTKESVIHSSRESLMYLRANIVHFLAADCEPITSIAKLLIAIGAIDLEEMKNAQPKKGQVLVTPRDRFKVYTVILKNKHYDNLCEKEFQLSLRNLLLTLKRDQVQHFRIAYYRDMCDTLPRNMFTDKLVNVFINTGIKITICYGKIEIPPEELRPQIIAEFHNSLIDGHKGITKTYRRIRERYTWPNLREDVTEYIRGCRNCAEQKLIRARTREPMLITDTPLDTFDKVSLDTVGPLRTTPDGNRHILTIQDNLSKYCIGVAIPNIDATTIAHALAMNLYSLYGARRCILTDRGKAFVSKLMRKLSKIFKIKQVTTSGYRPQTNGALERSHAVLEAYIRQYSKDYDDWDRLLPYALFAYNTSVHEATNFTPYEIVFGRQARSPFLFPNRKEARNIRFLFKRINYAPNRITKNCSEKPYSF